MSAGAATAAASVVSDGGIDTEAIFAGEGIFANGVLESITDRRGHAARRLRRGERSHVQGLSRSACAVKRTFDLLGASLLLVLGTPLLLIVAAAIRLEGGGPVFFRQTRIGRDGRPFRIVKFRTMVVGADAMKESLRELNEASGLFKIADDPRVTRVGGFVRRSCLDEVPQLLNVLRGEMSLVGPRPLIPEEDCKIVGSERERLRTAPGMTGPWQVLGAARIPLQEMVAIDCRYVATWTIWGDIGTLARTVPCVLARRGM
jgi:lipopolysaccharide/colanic/teichoic acid biosynthesis glycosyltransferase